MQRRGTETGNKASWQVVAGFGAHIKATRSRLTIQVRGEVTEYPISDVHHLLVVGGHHIHTGAIIALLRAGAAISFFEADGEPVGMLRPSGDRTEETLRELQENRPGHSFAIEIARASLQTRLMHIAEMSCGVGRDLLYQGEREILERALAGFEYLITLEEVRRLFRLTNDMYYEVMARALPPALGFHRRGVRPYLDVVNSMLSFGYAILAGNVEIAVAGARLDPDIGMLTRGPLGLVYDIMEPLRPVMVDLVVFRMVREGISPDEYDVSGSRCMLSGQLTTSLLSELHRSLDQAWIAHQVTIYRNALLNRAEFFVMREKESPLAKVRGA